NMWFFWIFGNNIEDRLGHIPFLIFYLVGGLLASACHWLMATGPAAFVPVIGASGAVAVTLGAYAVTYPFARVRTFIFIVVFFTIVELPALAVLGAWFLMQMVSAAEVSNVQMGGGVAWWAHIGGFAAGAILMPLLTAGSRQPIRQIAGVDEYPSDFDR
ncbi:MAG: rhomboid family intramembrane serine protease, partial [Planctomycetota bacterium]